jgi:hypothetical protein
MKDTECLKCIICIECFVLQQDARSPDHESEVRYWRNQSDGRHVCTDHDCTLPRSHERRNLHHRHKNIQAVQDKSEK